MKKLVALVFIMIITPAYADVGPTSLGEVKIGMSKQDYIGALNIKPFNCNTLTNQKGQIIRSEMKSLKPDSKSLCHDFRFGVKKSGIEENIKIGTLSYDVVQADYDSSSYIKSLGNDSKAIFIEDKLVSFALYNPKVNLETLQAKYGLPNLTNTMKTEACTNRRGNQFNNLVGKLDAIWVNGEVNAIHRTIHHSPIDTCTHPIIQEYYILEESKKLEPIEAAILDYIKENASKEASDSPF